MLYLQTLFRTDWNNFLERLSVHDEEILGQKNNRGSACDCESIRAQTLTITVSYMMYYETLLRLLTNFARFNEETINDFYLIFLNILYHAKFMEMWRRIKIQRKMILINLYIAALTFVIHILLILYSIVLKTLHFILSRLKVIRFRIVFCNMTTTIVGIRCITI